MIALAFALMNVAAPDRPPRRAAPFPPPCRPAPRAPRPTASQPVRRWYLTGYPLKESEARLPAFRYRILTGTLPFRPAYALSVAVDRVLVPRFALALPGFKLRGNSLDVKAQLMTHVGREHDTEVDAAAILRSG